MALSETEEYFTDLAKEVLDEEQLVMYLTWVKKEYGAEWWGEMLPYDEEGCKENIKMCFIALLDE